MIGIDAEYIAFTAKALGLIVPDKLLSPATW
jgi:hypothetical protein